jgi:hypothetical protein
LTASTATDNKSFSNGALIHGRSTIFRCFSRTFLRTGGKNVETGKDRFFEITGCEPLHDGIVENCNGVLLGAAAVSPEYVSKLLASTERSIIKTKSASKSSLLIKPEQKEEI